MEQPTRPVFLYWLRWLQGCILRFLSGICWMQECDSNSLTCSEKRVRLEHPWPSLNRQPSKPAQIETKHDAAKWKGILCNGQRVSTLDPAATSATATWLIRYLLLSQNMTISRVDTSYRANLHYSWNTAWPCCSFGTLIRILTLLITSRHLPPGLRKDSSDLSVHPLRSFQASDSQKPWL